MSNKNKLRIEVARDVIAQVKAGRYLVQKGRYLGLIVDGQYADIKGPSNESFQKVFQENKGIECRVCALGATFVSLVNLKNECSVLEMRDEQSVCFDENDALLFSRVREVFGIRNMVLIESAFETSNLLNRPDSGLSLVMVTAASEWGYRYFNPEDRLIAIMRNVIRNGGNFKLPKRLIKKAHRDLQ